jgi:hypothetical protein
MKHCTKDSPSASECFEKSKKLMDLVAALARKDERDRCARIAESVFPPDSSKCKWGKVIASAIRRSA